MNQNHLKNEAIRNYNFLAGMYSDSYFPKFLVDNVKAILIELCFQIENKPPGNLEALYKLTHPATEAINQLQSEFDKNRSEIETVAREVIAMDFEHIAKTYGFEADIEELIAPRDW